MKALFKVLLLIISLSLLSLTIYIKINTSEGYNELENINPDQEGIKAAAKFLFEIIIGVISFILAGILFVFYVHKKRRFILINIALLILTIILNLIGILD